MMKLSKVIVSMVLFGSVFASPGEEKRPGFKISYTRKPLTQEDRFVRQFVGGTLAVAGLSGNLYVSTHPIFLTGTMAGIFAPNRISRLLERVELGLTRSFNATALFGTYLVAYGLLGRYYTSNLEWDIRTKKREYSGRLKNPLSSDDVKGTTKTIQFPRPSRYSVDDPRGDINVYEQWRKK